MFVIIIITRALKHMHKRHLLLTVYDEATQTLVEEILCHYPNSNNTYLQNGNFSEDWKNCLIINKSENVINLLHWIII